MLKLNVKIKHPADSEEICGSSGRSSRIGVTKYK
jgi:hypothetical protein